jgi:hypothetical protein
MIGKPLPALPPGAAAAASSSFPSSSSAAMPIPAITAPSSHLPPVTGALEAHSLPAAGVRSRSPSPPKARSPPPPPPVLLLGKSQLSPEQVHWLLLCLRDNIVAAFSYAFDVRHLSCDSCRPVRLGALIHMLLLQQHALECLWARFYYDRWTYQRHGMAFFRSSLCRSLCRALSLLSVLSLSSCSSSSLSSSSLSLSLSLSPPSNASHSTICSGAASAGWCAGERRAGLLSCFGSAGAGSASCLRSSSLVALAQNGRVFVLPVGCSRTSFSRCPTLLSSNHTVKRPNFWYLAFRLLPCLCL